MRKLLIGLLAVLLVVSLSFAATGKDDLAAKIQEMKAQGLYDAQLWNEFYGTSESPVDNGRVGGDDIASCTTILSLPYDDTGNTCSYTDDYDEVCPYSGSTSPDVVYCYAPSSDATVTISLCNPGTSYDTKLYVYEDSYTPGFPYACNDDYCPGYISEIQDLPMWLGSTYYIVVDGYGGACGDYEITLEEAPPPPPPPCDMYWANCLHMGTGSSYPTYSWRNVTTNSVPVGYSYTPGDGILGDDDWEGPFPIGFTFTSFGVEDYTQFCICSNGFVMLGSSGSTSYGNTNIPNASAPNGILPFFWDDMDAGDPDVGGTIVYWGNDIDGNLVVSFINLPQYGATGPDGGITAQVILKTNGNIKYQYSWVGTALDISSATIGVENADGTAGVEYRYNLVTTNPLQSCLAIEFGCDPDNLPVELTAFEGVPMSNSAQLTWTTASESENDHFVLYRSTSAENGYIQIATIAGVGESATESNYSYMDQNLVNGTTYYYRIADVDINGVATAHGDIVEVTPTDGAMGVMVSEYKLHQNYPNPFNPTTTITYDVKETGHVTLTVFNIVGQEVATLVDEVKDNNRYQVTFDASGLAAGVYFYRLNVNDFSDVAKMVILK
jgi:hypothetical protein